MSQNIKISKNRILEIGTANNKNYDIVLGGTSALALVNSEVQRAANDGTLNLAASHFKQIYTIEHFFYLIDVIDAELRLSLIHI